MWLNIFNFHHLHQTYPRLMRETCPKPVEALLFSIPAVQQFLPKMFCYGALKNNEIKNGTGVSPYYYLNCPLRTTSNPGSLPSI